MIITLGFPIVSKGFTWLCTPNISFGKESIDNVISPNYGKRRYSIIFNLTLFDIGFYWGDTATMMITDTILFSTDYANRRKTKNRKT